MYRPVFDYRVGPAQSQSKAFVALTELSVELRLRSEVRAHNKHQVQKPQNMQVKKQVNQA